MLKKLLKIIKKNTSDAKDNFGDFVKEEKREVTELKNGQENMKRYFHDSLSIFRDYFIPNDNNDNKPKILRPRQLVIITILLLTLKIFSVGYLFLVYQDEAKMSETTAAQILSLTNESRIANDVSPLNSNAILNQAAQSKAEDMLINDYFSHTSPDGRMPWNFVNRNSYAYTLVGENLALNFLGADDAHAALMASPGHKKNILNPKYTDLGLAVVNGKINGEETNILVEIFGAKNETPLLAATPIKTVAAISSGETKEPIINPDMKTGAQVAHSVVVKAEEKSYTPPTIKTALATSAPQKISPAEPEVLNNLPLNPSYVDLNVNPQVENAAKVINVSKVIYFSFLLFLMLALIINIVVRATVQHKSVIFQTILLIILVLSLLLVDFNFIKELGQAAQNIVVF
ncbi:MAG: CAP domain-containing protein [Patescibacteria group bacterium]